MVLQQVFSWIITPQKGPILQLFAHILLLIFPILLLIGGGPGPPLSPFFIGPMLWPMLGGVRGRQISIFDHLYFVGFHSHKFIHRTYACDRVVPVWQNSQESSSSVQKMIQIFLDEMNIFVVVDKSFLIHETAQLNKLNMWYRKQSILVPNFVTFPLDYLLLIMSNSICNYYKIQIQIL